MPKSTKKTDAPAPPPASRVNGGRSTHLSPEAESLVVERIITGDTNVELNEALQTAGFLPVGESISDRTLTEYRKSNAVKVSHEKLTEEARQAGHAALSEALVLSIRAMRAGGRELLTNSGRFASADPQVQRNAAMVFFKSAEFVWSKLGYKDVLAAINESEQEALNAIEQSGANEETKAEMMLAVKEANNKLLRDLVTRRRAQIAASPENLVAEGTTPA